MRENKVILQPETLPVGTKKRATRSCNERNVVTLNELFEPPTFFYQGPRLTSQCP